MFNLILNNFFSRFLVAVIYISILFVLPVYADDCDLGHSSTHGHTPWITVLPFGLDEPPLSNSDTDPGSDPVRGGGCEIQVNLNQPNTNGHQFAFVSLSNQETFSNTYSAEFRIKNIDDMLDNFKNNQKLTFFSLRTESPEGRIDDFLKLVISKAERSPRSRWTFNAVWSTPGLLYDNEEISTFSIARNLKDLEFSIYWGHNPNGQGRYVDIEVYTGGFTKSIRFNDGNTTMPDWVQLGYIKAEPVLDIGNRIDFYVFPPQLPPGN